MPGIQKLEVPVQGMDCTECTMHVRHALESLPGVQAVEVFLSSEKAVLQLDPQQVSMEQIRQAVVQAGYQVVDGQPGAAAAAAGGADASAARAAWQNFTRPVVTLLGVVFGVVLFVVVVGEWLGLFEAITARLPWPVGAALVGVFGYPVFWNVIRAALRRQVISHTLMSLGVLAALAVGEWATAVVVVFFMRVGDYVEHFTAERARRAVKDLTALATQTARLEQGGSEVVLPIGQVHPGDVVVIRPGEQVPVDGEVLSGHAAIDQATITGEALPVEAGPGAPVYAATLLRSGSLRVRALQVGADSTFGRVIRLVEEAEAHRADVQRIADRFSAYYLPVVAGIAALTFLFRRDPLATAAVLVVACSCSFALATPIAMLASIGAAARHGLMIKGGRYLELLDQAQVLLIDKTGTLTLGRPILSDCRVLAGDGSDPTGPDQLLRLAASAERYSEHPLAEAVREEAVRRGCRLEDPQEFQSIPGQGVRARVNGRLVEVGSRRMFPALQELENSAAQAASAAASALEAQGKSLLFVGVDGSLVGLLAASDQLRPEVPAALGELRQLGFTTMELLTGDNPRAAAALAEKLGPGLEIRVRADLLPEHKIEIVRQHQAQGRRVVMVGDGVNDAPALAQADVGIAMGAARSTAGAAGSDIAIEAAHIALMRDDWRLVPEVVCIARRTMNIVRMNIGFTGLYNLVGLSLAAFGFLPPILAAAAQSLPDLGILANSSRLLRQK